MSLKTSHWMRTRLPAILVGIALGLCAAPGALDAAVVAEGVYTVQSPERASVGFRLILTASGARLIPSAGEILAFSYGEKSALVIDRPSKSYFLLPLELVSPLLAEGIGFDPRTLGATVSGRAKKLLGFPCSEVVVSGTSPKLTLRTWRLSDPSWSKEYALLEGALGLPWTQANPPAVFLGLPLAGSVETGGRRPFKAFWEITKITHDNNVSEDFGIPAGYQMDLQRLLTLQGGTRQR